MRLRHLRAIAAPIALASLLLGGPSPASGPQAVSGASSCSTTTASAGYTVQVCLAPSGPVSGTISPSATVTVSTTARVAYVTFCLDGSMTTTPTCVDGGAGYLVRDFRASSQPSQTQTVWSFALSTAHWVDGSHALLVVATMRDGTRTAPATTSLSFGNGDATQPVNTASPTIATGTTPAAGAPLVVAAVGDGAAGDPISRAVASRISGWAPNLFLYLGDVYERGSWVEFMDWYGATYGSLRSITDPVIGNHEYLSASDPATGPAVVPAGIAYFDYWNDLPDYYSFDAGGWHFIALNSNQTPMTSAKWKAQLSWLSSDLAAHPGSCTIAFWHHPAYNVGSEPIPGSAKTLWSMLAGRVALVVNGHDHTYQRWVAMDASGTPSPGGTVELVDGTGGHSAGSFKTTDSRVAARSTVAGALRLSLSSGSAAIQFISSSGTLIDSSSLTCH
ncbi:MAG TPA: metallophosphoesterase [Candidatus Limnocylindrales bacterium]